ncbi:hypothetical protein BV25DRAFT_1841251 [Artomyces pyxidatus]|uniref:Uncharacterized protein n=1 Tax=Artomyces pyxidatus TaxID=48021 RepID=A0ACB8SPX5_9AGAM|nr:hypothetical protein BV25DRAFT_1841251 [Artomyces pyxidatus]
MDPSAPLAPDAQIVWPAALTINTAQHIRRVSAAMRDAQLNDTREQHWYEAYDRILNFLAELYSTETKYFSVAPQAPLEVEVKRAKETGILPTAPPPQTRSKKDPDLAEEMDIDVYDEANPEGQFSSGDSSMKASVGSERAEPAFKIPQPELRHRFTDFMITMRDAHERKNISAIIEAKTKVWGDEGVEDDFEEDTAVSRFRKMLPQVVQQVQFAFFERQDQDEVWSCSMVGNWFICYQFFRDTTPTLNVEKIWRSGYKRSTQNDPIADAVPNSRLPLVQMLNEDGSDYTEEFKTAWDTFIRKAAQLPMY